MCSSTPAVRCRRNEGTCTQTYAHKYLWQGLYCQVICTKWPYHRLNDSSTLGSQALLYQRQHRRRKIRPPAAKVQALRGARLKALLALDFCLCMLGRSCKSLDSQYATTDTCRSTQGFPLTLQNRPLLRNTQRTARIPYAVKNTITPLTPMYEYTIYFNAAEGICR